VDEEATAACRAKERCTRLGRAPSRAVGAEVGGRRITSALRLDDGRLWCATCGGDLGAADGGLYATLHLTEHAVERRSAHGLRYPGSERFVLRHFCCPHCATQVDVQIGRLGEAPVRAIEVGTPSR
jgi:N-methylhydantoinase B